MTAGSVSRNRVALTWPDLTGRPRPEPDAVERYGDDMLQRVDLWLPADAVDTPRPVVLMVHGGCWQSAIADRRLMDWIADDLRRDGIAVWNIDYRGVDRDGGGYPGTFLDVAAAADLLRSVGPNYALDPTRVVAIGHSAGGHLALWLAARGRLSAHSPLWCSDPLPLRHVVSLGGLPDLAAVEGEPGNGCGTEVIARLVGGSRADRFADTSVAELLPIGVPHDLVNGREDRIVPYRFAIEYRENARLKGDSVTLHTIPATGHVELIAPETSAWAIAKSCIRKALERTKPEC